MNQENIGKFIAECRKKKNLTQSELAEKLGVTDRSISNWENGKNMPDLSLFKPLCEILELTINELLSGEKLSKEEYQKKLEENIVNTIDYSSKKLEQTNKLIGLIFFWIGVLIMCLGLFAFNPDSHFCLFSVVIGTIISTLGFYKLIKSKSYLKNIIFLILFFLGFMSIIILFDYIGVAYNNRPPIFSKRITYTGNVIYYDTLFYDVYRCYSNEKNEYWVIEKNNKPNNQELINYCK